MQTLNKTNIMTKEERDLLMPVVREIMGKSNRDITDDDVLKALKHLDMVANASAMSEYFYELPDYGQMVGEVPDILRPLLDTGEDHDGLPSVDDFMTSCSQLDRSTLATAVDSIIYFWLDQWHKGNEEYGDGVWMHPIHVAIMLAERFTLRECLPVLLEMERQDRGFAEVFFDECDMVGMVPACIYCIATVDDLPLLADFMLERGIHSFVKAEVAAAVSTLPRRAPKTLPMVQQWLCDLLAVFADDIDPAVGDVMLLEAIIHCCIHTRCEAAKAMIIRMYSKYKLPNILIPGGVNEVRKSIKKADIGVLKEELECAETIWQNAQTSWDDEDDYEDYDDDGYDDYDDEEDDDFDDEGLAPRQEYCGSTYGGAYRYMPVQKLKKYTLRIELKNSNPLVWRELEVPSSLCLSSLATAILLAMGWDEDHLHQFKGKGRDCYSTSVNDPGDSFFSQTKDGSRYGISHLLQKKGDSTMFEYDFGDSWYHTVKLKEVGEYADGEAKSVKLTGGANACPPDDCGGIHRYNYLVELMQNKPRSRELSEFYDWMGCKWDPEYFPMKEAAKAVDRRNK